MERKCNEKSASSHLTCLCARPQYSWVQVLGFSEDVHTHTTTSTCVCTCSPLNVGVLLCALKGSTCQSTLETFPFWHVRLPLPGHNLLSHRWCLLKKIWAISQLQTWPLATVCLHSLGVLEINHPVHINFKIYIHRVKQSILWIWIWNIVSVSVVPSTFFLWIVLILSCWIDCVCTLAYLPVFSIRARGSLWMCTQMYLFR